MKSYIKNNKKIIITFTITGSLIAAGLLFAATNNNNFLANIAKNIKTNHFSQKNNSTEEEPIIVQTKKLSLINANYFILSSGTTSPFKEADISPKASGSIVKIYFHEGSFVQKGEIIAEIEKDATLLTALKNAEDNLEKTKKATKEEIKAAEKAVEVAETNLKNAEISLSNTKNSAHQAVINAYTTALNNSRTAVLTATNAIIDATNLQNKYFTENDQQAKAIAEKKALSIKILLGKEGAGYWDSQFILSLDGGVKKEIEEASEIFSEEKIDQILNNILPGLEAVRDLLSELRTDLDWKSATPAEKSTVDLERSNIENLINTILISQQNIATAKINEKNANDKVQSAYELAKKQLESSQTNLENIKKKTELQIFAAQSQLDSVQARINNTLITAPFSGTIEKIYFQEGEIVSPNRPFAKIVNQKEIKVEIGLSPSETKNVQIGQKVEITPLQESEKHYLGEIYYISPTADPLTKKFLVKIKINNESQELKSGLVVRVKIFTQEIKNVLLIPKTAIFKEEDKEKIYVIEKGEVKIKEIKTIPFDDKNLLVEKGLKEGEEIVLNSDYILQEGEKVKTIPN